MVCRAEHRELTGSIDRMLRTGRLTTVLPGVYAPAADRVPFALRVRAVVLSQPDAVLTGATAATLSFWPGLRTDVVECAVPARRTAARGFRFVRRHVPPELISEHNGARLTTPALTALDLSSTRGGEALDEVLRTRATTLGLLHEALQLTAGRSGNEIRRELLLDSRDEPWSEAERVCHRLLRAAGITGWRANAPVCVDGRRYYLDVAFWHPRLVVEIDGRRHQDDLNLFESDRERQNALVLAGWRVLRFTWAMLRDHPERVVEAIRQALAEKLTPGSPARRR